MIFLISFILILCICVKYIYDQNENNLNADLIQLYDKNNYVINEKIKEKSPLVIHNDTKIDMTIQSLIRSNPGYIIVNNNKYISFDSFKDEDKKISIYQNDKMCNELSIKSLINSGLSSFACIPRTIASISGEIFLENQPSFSGSKSYFLSLDLDGSLIMSSLPEIL